ncbi:MAG: hypothetical protein QME52_08305 [Bacteroidota bacterium]|nr:hypothetical protein [Bacteroidota bacterium]
MKHIILLITLTVILIGTAESKPIYQGSVSYGIFHSSLSRHGEWIDSHWGHAWRPVRVAHGWRPYLNGRWAWTDYGWYWISYEPFGWATFHYGRWHYDDYYGWIWIPDDVWGPAWVEWRYDDDYIGWAPLSPYAPFHISIGITFINHWVTPIHYWNFIPCRNFTASRVVDYVQPIDRARRIYGSTRAGTLIRHENNRVINRGIDREIIERKGNTRINRVEIVERDRGQGERFLRDGGRERIEVYRPRFEDKQLRERETMKERTPAQRDAATPERERNIDRGRETIKRQSPTERRDGPSRSWQRNFQREDRRGNIENRDKTRQQRQEQQQEIQKRREDNQIGSETRVRENRDRQQPQSQERRDESRGGQERRKKP